MRYIPIDGLEPGMILARDIKNTSKTMMLRGGTELTTSYICQLINQGYMGAYITDDFSKEVELKESINQEIFDEGVAAVKEENLDAMVGTATKIVADLYSQNDISVDVLNLRSEDDYTYHHSVNVAVYAVVVGKKMGLSEKELQQLSQAAICHDLGKLEIPRELLHKPGKLTDEEFEIIKSHPRYSFDMLHSNSGISSVVRQAVLCHHENENGSGYPLGRTGDEISKIAKIIHVVDVYDALTSKRPYKDAYAPAEAFDYLISGKNVLFDADVVDATEQAIPAYPLGIEVGLSNNERALVVGATKNHRRPVIKLEGTGEIVDLSRDQRYKGVKIIASGIMTRDFAKAIEVLNEDRQSVRVKKEKVMIVDDAVVTVNQIKQSLIEDYEVITMGSGIEALSHIKKTDRQPDLIIMDIEMPVMDGIATARKIKDIEKGHIPVIFLSSSSSVETVLKCRAIGAVDYIVKPAKPIYVKERVGIALKRIREMD